MVRELNVLSDNEETLSQEPPQDIDMENSSEASVERNTASYVPSSAKSEGESDVNISDNLSYGNNEYPRNRRGGGSLVASSGSIESSGINNSSNRSVIDFSIEKNLVPLYLMNLMIENF